MNRQGDYIIRATAAGGQIRAFAATTKTMVETARQHHNTSPVMTAALGRLLTAGAMMGSMLKGEKDVLTLQIRGDGPGKGLTVTAGSDAYVKGYALNPSAINPANYFGKFDVGGILGNGYLNVIKDMGLKEPYSGQVDLVTGEIAEDLTYYFATSEQVPSSVGLGVLMNKDNTVRQAGGFILQLMPFAEESVISKLEENLSNVSSVTSMLNEGKDPEAILHVLLDPMEIEILDVIDTGFRCDCSHERVSRVIASLGKRDLKSLIDEGEPVEVKCDFCNTAYTFSLEELKEIYSKGKK